MEAAECTGGAGGEDSTAEVVETMQRAGKASFLHLGLQPKHLTLFSPSYQLAASPMSWQELMTKARPVQDCGVLSLLIVHCVTV